MDDAGRAGAPGRRRYHHGDLRAALLDGALGLLADVGLAGFSVAELARRVGVSTAAPYRHFADRDRLLAAVATRVATELAAALEAAVDGATSDGARSDDAGSDDADRLVAAAGAYVVFVIEHRVGLDLIFAPGLREQGDRELADAGRRVMGVLFEPARAIEPDPVAALSLVEQVVALAHGYAGLDAHQFLTADRLTDDPTSVRATRAAAALVRGHLR